ncbi:uncharacterized protein LOC123529683 [Mercenaria mercenaria]|uniref:uncharacterized protein LOC123529683 n=1 Tax=Mercenaria mercenaria TaxID=6596 RepID=UPI00234EB3AB|nr:uncharacterized protein LOC123529683 [Mercenaria mercenaria]
MPPTTKMDLKLPFLISVLVIEGNQSMDIITPEQILARIAALEKKDLELTEFNKRLLAMVENQREQMEQKDMTINQLLKQVNVLEQKETDNQNLKTEVSKLQARIIALESKVKQQTDIKENQEGNGQKSAVPFLHGLETHKGNIKSEFLNVILANKKHLPQTRPEDVHLAEVKRIKPDKEKETLKIRQASSAAELVAFHAVIDLGHVSHIGIHQNIVFESVLLNLASSYHVQHGIFIAPTNGLYLFSTSIMADNNGKIIYTELVKNGAVLARTQGQGHSGSHDQGSVTVVTQLNASDEVWVRLHCCADDSLYGERYSTFTGVNVNCIVRQSLSVFIKS